jgi:hypothetical protein
VRGCEEGKIIPSAVREANGVRESLALTARLNPRRPRKRRLGNPDGLGRACDEVSATTEWLDVG